MNYWPNLLNHRPDIDGLRALAVIAIVLNHFNSSFLPGGFLGLDIFFVISGYLITSIFCDKKSCNGLKSGSLFYANDNYLSLNGSLLVAPAIYNSLKLRVLNK